jgi:hypothetical protein
MNVTAVQTLQFLPAARPQALEGANYAGGTSIFRNALRSGVANVRRATVACALIVSAQRVAGQCRTNHCQLPHSARERQSFSSGVWTTERLNDSWGCD